MRVELEIEDYDSALEFARGLGKVFEEKVPGVSGATLKVDHRDTIALSLQWQGGSKTEIRVRKSILTDSFVLNYTVTPELREYIVDYANHFMIFRHADSLISYAHQEEGYIED